MSRSAHRWPASLLALSLLLVAALALAGRGPTARAAGVAGDDPQGAGEEAAVPPPPEDFRVSWDEIQRLAGEQKMTEAVARAAALKTAARAAGDVETATRALIKEIQLRLALGQVETAAEQLRAEPWPEEAPHHTAVELFYGELLRRYLDVYFWEIEQRERVATGGEADLALWTRAQIAGEANGAFLAAWRGLGRWAGEPLGALAPYIEQNDYPPRIRGTLRDSVTYLWAELLADTRLWRPEQESRLFALDLEALLGEPGAGSGRLAGEELADPEIHPLRKLAAILAELEAWHAGAGRLEAALEARLERLRRLHAAFGGAADRRSIRESLESHLAAFDRGYEWWSMGQALLAEMVQGEEEPDSLARARSLAGEGAAAHPRTIGALRCLHIVAAIEAPDFQVAAMSSDAPGRRSVEITHRNLARLHFRAWPLAVEELLAQRQSYGPVPDGRMVERLVATRPPAATWPVELPSTADYRSHRTFATPPVTSSGVWLIAASAREDFAGRGNRREAVFTTIGDLVLIGHPDIAREGATRDGARGRSKARAGDYEVEARSGSTGRPLPGVEVEIYGREWRGGTTSRLASALTGADGRASFALTEPWEGVRFALARRDGDVALGLDPRGRLPGEPRAGRAALIYTDRSVYRPGQTIHWKIAAFSSDAATIGATGGEDAAARFHALSESAVALELRDANGEIVAETSARTNRFGTASGDFVIPGGRLLGQWSLLEPALGASSSVRVEAYKRPTFEVTLEPPREDLRLNRPATLGGTARYYFGLPVATGSVAWRVEREPVWIALWRWPPVPPGAAELVAGGTAELAADGGFAITFTPRADERLAGEPGVSYRYRVSAEVTDEGGETRSAERGFRLGFVAVEATVESSPGFLRAGEEARLTVRRADLDGEPRAGRGAWRLVALRQPPSALLPADQPLPPAPEGALQTPGDLLRPRWDTSYEPAQVLASWEDGEEVAQGEVEHGADGIAEVALPRLAGGGYRLRYRTEDAFGAAFETQRELVVAADGEGSLALPLLLAAERAEVEAGGTARFLVHTGLPQQELLLEVHRRGERLERRAIAPAQAPRIVEIPVGPDDRGGFTVTLTILRDHQLVRQAADVRVPWSDRALVVELATFRDTLRPGARETWRVRVEGGTGEGLAAGSAELLAYMYDRSLDLFAPHTPPDPLGLYPSGAGAPELQTTLGQGQIVWRDERDFATLPDYPALAPDRLAFLDDYPIGGPGRGGMRHKMVALQAPAAGPTEEAGAEAMQSGFGEPQADASVARDADAAAAAPAEAVELRTEFAETAFWEPHLVLDEDGGASFEFTVPDSVTEWSVWAHALTRDLAAGSVNRTARSVKELLVRPYLPRFLREGDRAEIRVQVNNATDRALSGTVRLEIFDPASEESLLERFGLAPDQVAAVPFTAPPLGAADLSFPLAAPEGVGEVAFRAVARAGGFSDGEQRALPLLPGRMHLIESRFAALSGASERTLRFDVPDDPTRGDERLVVTLDAQLFNGLLGALPYLVSYPYDCTEQILNRFVSAGILAALYERYPAVAALAKEASARETPFEAFAGVAGPEDPNRTMALEETPWAAVARGERPGPEAEREIVALLDPAIAAAHRRASLAELQKAQTASGAFPWWPGGPPSPYMTVYILSGLSRALEFGVEAPRDVVERAWGYLSEHVEEERRRGLLDEECCWELVTFLNYVLSSYPDPAWTGGVFTADDRRAMLDFSWRHWKEHSPLLKALLAMTLERAGRGDDARLVLASIMDSARTDPDLGAYWAPEERAWLWYNDTVETHALALAALLEIAPEDPRRHGLAHWLFLDKKLSHWKSTRATAEAIHTLVRYLEHEDQLDRPQEATVEAGPLSARFAFAPDRFVPEVTSTPPAAAERGRENQVVLEGEEIDPPALAAIEVRQSTPGLLFASATWHFATDRLPEEAAGDLLRVERRFFRRLHDGREWTLQPLAEGTPVAVGDELVVQLAITARHAAEYVHLRDPRGAGFEPVALISGFKWDLGIGWYEEVRDSGANFFIEWLPAGTYTLEHRLRAATAGTFRVGPATLQSMYAPEFAAYSAGARVEVRSASGEQP